MKLSWARPLVFLLLALLLAQQTSAPAAPQGLSISVEEVVLGAVKIGVFEARPERTFSANETLAAKVRIAVSGPRGAGYVLAVGALVYDPLGALLLNSSRSVRSTLTGGYAEWEYVFSFELAPDAIAGYYTLVVRAEAGGASSERAVQFFVSSSVSAKNYYEVVYAVELVGEGRVGELYVALPQDSAGVRVVAGPLVFPQPREVREDPLGNRYAVYRDVEVGPQPFRVTVKFAVAETLSYTHVDAPLSSLAAYRDALSTYLRPSRYIESDNPEIRSLALKLTSGASTVLEAAKRIADFTSTSISYNPSLGSLSASWKLGALWTLHARQGVCLQFARLFVALARAAGVPARVVEGLLARPPSGETDYMHAWAEVYVPGFGWLPVEPQARGYRVGVAPPGPGYVPLVKGLGEGPGEEGAVSVYLTYTGRVEVRQSYSYAQRPLEALEGKVSLKPEYRSRVYFGDLLTLSFSAPPGTHCDVSVSAPGGPQVLFSKDCSQSISLTANKTGIWRIEVFASNPRLAPAYLSFNVTVEPRPLELAIEPVELQLFKVNRVAIRTRPATGGVALNVTYEDCLQRKALTLVTAGNGEALLELQPLLPCKVRLTAESVSEGYAHAEASAELEVYPPREVLAAALLVLLLAAVAAVRRRSRRNI